MSFLFLGLRDLYLPAAAAYMHIHSLDTIPLSQELLKLDYFRPAQKEDEGKLLYVGKDRNHHDIYITCVSQHPEIFARGVQSLLSLCQLSLSEMHVVPCILENPQLGTVYGLLKRLGKADLAGQLALKVISNRANDLKLNRPAVQ